MKAKAKKGAEFYNKTEQKSIKMKKEKQEKINKN